MEDRKSASFRPGPVALMRFTACKRWSILANKCFGFDTSLQKYCCGGSGQIFVSVSDGILLSKICLWDEDFPCRSQQRKQFNSVVI